MRNRFLLILFITICFVGSKAFSQIRTLQQDSTASGNLSPAGKIDTFRITPTADGQINLTLTVTNANYTWVALYDKDTSTQLNSSNTNGTITLSSDGLAAGTYFVRVYSYFGNETPVYTLKYTETPAPVNNDVEPNNNITQAQTLQLNSGTTGHVGYYYNKQRDTADWYKVTTNSDGILQFKLTSNNNRYMWVYLYDNNGTTLLNAQNTNGTIIMNSDGLAAGTYYVRIFCYYNNEFAPYTLIDSLFTPAQANDNEPNDSRAQAQTLQINSGTTGHVGYYYNNQRDTADWYKVTTNADGVLQFNLTSNNNKYVWVYLYDNNGTTLLNAQNTNGTITMNSDGLAAGTYYVRIFCYYNNEFAPYTLTDSLFTPAQANDVEPNDSRSQAETLQQNSTATGHVGYYYNNLRDTSDWYKVTTNADGMLQFKLTSNNNKYVWIYLYDNDGTTQLNAQNTNGAITMNTDGLAAGTYYVKVNCYYYNSEFAPYTLTDSLFTYNPNDPEPNGNPFQSAIIPGNSTATGHVNFYYNGLRETPDWWNINYTDSTGNLKIRLDLLSAKIDNGTRYVWLQVYKDTAAAPVYNNNTNALSTDINFTSLTKGTYYFKLFTYYNTDFSAYAITPFFTSEYVNATISLLNAIQGTGCSDNILSYRLGGSTSPYTPYTVKLYRNGAFYDSVVINRDTVTFNYLPEGTYYATARGFGAPANVIATSGTSQFSAISPTPVPTDVPVINKQGRTLYSTSHAARETYQWYRNGVLITGANDSTYFAASSGNYNARFANSCGIGPSSNTISFSGDYQVQTITFSPITDKTFGDSDFVLNATASSGLPVEFILISGHAQIIGNHVHIRGAGSVTIEARQTGDDNFGIATPVQQTFSVQKASQSISFGALSDKIYGSAAFPLNASSSSGLQVVYSVISGYGSFSGENFLINGIGTTTIRASQPGDSNYLPATPVDRSFCISANQLNPIVGPSIICPNKQATYTVDNISGATYSWRIAGGSTLASTSNTITVTWPASGSYTLIVNASGNCGATSNNDTLIVTAITSIQPDSVHNMLPANGAVNQQLPLTLSWIPANPDFYYTYDIYLWRADQSQPATPYVSNLTSVNYTIPLNSGLAYNTAYKWMVVAHNGSCTIINTGPVQQFTLIPLPDLQVYNVIAPTTAFSGQQISVQWKVKNNGPGNTQLNQRWTDAVLISADSVLDFTNPAGQLRFPVVPLLTTTKLNVSALNSGESYTDSALFTLPINFGGNLYVHVITNYFPSSENPVLESTLVNDTAHALPPMVVTLSPAPDLQVDSIVNPNNTFSGSTINLIYKVSNHGALANGTWIDKIYISKDPLFNINTAILLKFPTTKGIYYPAIDAIINRAMILQQDSSYTTSIPVVIPNFIYGSYYVYVFTNATSSLYEGPNTSNDVNHGNLMQVFLTPTPQLVPTNVTVPSNVSNTQPVTVKWTTLNQGAYDNFEKYKGHYFVKTGTCFIQWEVLCDRCIPPPPTPGWFFSDSLGDGSSYWKDKIYISTDGSGLNFLNATLLGQPEHGGIVRYSPEELQPGKCLPIGSTGAGYSLNISNAIFPGSTHPGSFYYTLPDNIPQGTYYFYVYSNPDKYVYEYPGSPQITRSNAFTVSWPDLTVSSVTVPNTGNSGQAVILNYNLLDIGPGALYNHYIKDYFYIGNNSSFDGTAQLIDSTVSTSSAALNTPVSLTKQVKIPDGLSGVKYFFVRTNVDSSFKEVNYVNNTSAGAPITINLTPSPDLVVSSIEVANTVYSSTGFPFKFTVTNNGAGVASGKWKDSIFISCDPVYNPASVYLVGERIQQNYIAAGNNYTDSFNLIVPLTYLIKDSACLHNDVAQVYFFVKTNGDNGIYEPVKSNNITGTSQKTIINTLVDHIVTNVNSDGSAQVGRYFNVNWTVENIGLNPNDYSYVGWFDKVYISTDSVLNSNAKLLGGKEINTRLNNGNSYNYSASFQIPSVATGSYYVLVKTNSDNTIPAERNLANNINLMRDGAGQPIKINITLPLLPDLVNSIESAPVTVAVGQPVTVIYKITNTGPGATYEPQWTDDIWLSNGFYPGGIFLGRKLHTGSLQPGQSYTDSMSALIPINLPQGNYTIVLNTNQDHMVFETNFSNNQSYKYISVYRPAPVDLVVNNINIADTVKLGHQSLVGWSLLNNSSNPAKGTETDGIYLSADAENSANDILIGTSVNKLDLLPLNSASFTLNPFVAGIPEGYYYVKVKTDILNNIIETDKQNNTSVASHTIYVTIPVLPMNTVTPDVLTTNFLYYKLIVPAGLRGKTISVKLVSQDSLVSNNQLYVGAGYLPSAAHFDYAFDKPNYGNQQVIIDNATDSVYYIAAKGTKSGGSSQNITLQATVLPFSILNVNASHGGNTGNVTIQIKGSLFRDSMTATLHGVSLNNTITASKIYFINSATVYATFNLQGAPLGLYDVSLQKPDATTASLPSSFTVEKTNNGGLLTGGGNNGPQSGSGNAPGCDPNAPSGLNSQLQTEVVAPAKVFVGWNFVMQINYSNTSNVDIPAQVKILYSIDGAPLAVTEAGLADGKTNLYIEFKDAVGPVNMIRAGGSGTIKVYGKAPPNGFAHELLHFTIQ